MRNKWNKKKGGLHVSYQKLFSHYYIDPESNTANYTRILSLINELRIISKMQIKQFIATEKDLAKSTYDKILLFLEEHYFIQRMLDYRYKKSIVYYITKDGIDFLGSSYTVPKNPYYNIEHCLKINDMLIEGMNCLGSHPYLNSIISERRLVFEMKDGKEAKESKGRIYKVPDFDFEFLSLQEQVDVVWHFEIELTLKSLTRYTQRILPYYLKILESKYTENDKIIYVVPTAAIQTKLMNLWAEIEHKNQKNYPNFVIVHFDNFATRLSELAQDLHQN